MENKIEHSFLFFNCSSSQQNKEDYLSKSCKESPSLVEDNAEAGQEANEQFLSAKDYILHRFNLLSTLFSTDF